MEPSAAAHKVPRKLTKGAEKRHGCLLSLARAATVAPLFGLLCLPATRSSLRPYVVRAGLYTRVETETGLQHFVGDAVGLRQTALQPLLDWAAAVVPAHVRSQVPLFLMATGGTRRLPLDQQEALMADARTVLASSGFR